MAAATAARSALALGKLTPPTTALFVCDVQERFRSVISGFPAVIDTARRLARGCDALGVPVLVTEQNPSRLGATVQELREVLPPGAPVFPKTLFSMVTPDVEQWLQRNAGVKHVVICGIETHVCVLQTGCARVVVLVAVVLSACL